MRWWTDSNKIRWRLNDGYNEAFRDELEAIRTLFHTTQKSFGVDEGRLADFKSSQGQEAKVYIERFEWNYVRTDDTNVVVGPVFNFRITLYARQSREERKQFTEQQRRSYHVPIPWYKQLWKFFVELLGGTYDEDVRWEDVTVTQTRTRKVLDGENTKIMTINLRLIFPSSYPLVPPEIQILDGQYIRRIEDMHSQHVFPNGQLCIFAGSGDWNPDRSTSATALSVAIDLLIRNYYRFGLKI